eukprot:188690-Rhodomonas_salina.2
MKDREHGLNGSSASTCDWETVTETAPAVIFFEFQVVTHSAFRNGPRRQKGGLADSESSQPVWQQCQSFALVPKCDLGSPAPRCHAEGVEQNSKPLNRSNHCYACLGQTLAAAPNSIVVANAKIAKPRTSDPTKMDKWDENSPCVFISVCTSAAPSRGSLCGEVCRHGGCRVRAGACRS